MTGCLRLSFVARDVTRDSVTLRKCCWSSGLYVAHAHSTYCRVGYGVIRYGTVANKNKKVQNLHVDNQVIVVIYSKEV